MAGRSIEREFLSDLLDATRAGRAAWTGTPIEGVYQFVAGDYLISVRTGETAPVVSLHFRGGQLLDSFTGADSAGEEGPPLSETLDAIYQHARRQALGLPRRWRSLARYLAAPTAEPSPAAPALAPVQSEA